MSESTKEEPIPGPWEANTRDGTLKVRGPATAAKYKQREVCRVYGANRATVDLITAAPDLLAACKGMLSRMKSSFYRVGGDVEVHRLWSEVMSEAESAIAKAEGK